MADKYPNKKVYEALNSWGFEEPFVLIPVDSPAIIGIYKINIVEKLLQYTSESPNDTSHGSGCQGKCLIDKDACCPFPN